MLVLQFPLQEHPCYRSSTKREIDDSSSTENDDEALRRKRIKRPNPQAQQGELNDFVYDDRHTILTA